MRAFSCNDIRTVELVGGAISAAYGRAVNLASKGRLLDELEDTVRALRESEAKLSYQALHDPLTGLPNRTLFLDRLRTAVSQRSDPEVAVLFVDLDGFKPVNDSLGHEAGDLLLMKAARRIQQVLRGNDTAARLGGDEFAIICRDAPRATSAMRVAERLLEVLEAPFELDGQEVARHGEHRNSGARGLGRGAPARRRRRCTGQGGTQRALSSRHQHAE